MLAPKVGVSLVRIREIGWNVGQWDGSRCEWVLRRGGMRVIHVIQKLSDRLLARDGKEGQACTIRRYPVEWHAHTQTHKFRRQRNPISVADMPFPLGASC